MMQEVPTMQDVPMIRRLVLALLPVAGFALGVAIALLAGPTPAGDLLPFGGWHLAAAVLGCAALAVTAAVLAAPPAPPRPAPRRFPAIPRSTRPGNAQEDPPTLSGYWRAHDEPDWPEGEVRREREREEEPLAAAR
jgi:hypothetical protein